MELRAQSSLKLVNCSACIIMLSGVSGVHSSCVFWVLLAWSRALQVVDAFMQPAAGLKQSNKSDQYVVKSMHEQRSDYAIPELTFELVSICSGINKACYSGQACQGDRKHVCLPLWAAIVAMYSIVECSIVYCIVLYTLHMSKAFKIPAGL